MRCGSGWRRPPSFGSLAAWPGTARTPGGPGSTSGCRRRIATSSETTRSRARTSLSMAQARRRPPLSKLLRLLSASRLSRAAQGVLERDRRLTSLERHAVDSNDRDDLAHRRGREAFVCAEETLEWEDALDDLPAVARGELEERRARVGRDAGDLAR